MKLLYKIERDKRFGPLSFSRARMHNSMTSPPEIKSHCSPDSTYNRRRRGREGSKDAPPAEWQREKAFGRRRLDLLILARSLSRSLALNSPDFSRFLSYRASERERGEGLRGDLRREKYKLRMITARWSLSGKDSFFCR